MLGFASHAKCNKVGIGILKQFTSARPVLICAHQGFMLLCFLCVASDEQLRMTLPQPSCCLLENMRKWQGALVLQK